MSAVCLLGGPFSVDRASSEWICSLVFPGSFDTFWLQRTVLSEITGLAPNVTIKASTHWHVVARRFLR